MYFIIFVLTHSVLEHISSTSFRCVYTILWILERVYAGQKTNSQSLYYFNSYMSFWTCIKSINNRHNMKMRPSTEGVNL